MENYVYKPEEVVSLLFFLIFPAFHDFLKIFFNFFKFQ